MSNRISQKEAKELVRLELIKLLKMDDVACPEWADNEIRGVRFGFQSAAEAAAKINSRSVF